MNGIIKWFSAHLKHIGLCGNTGFIAGTFAGIILSILNMQYEGALTLTTPEFFKITIELILFCWIVVVFVFVFFGKLKFSQVVIPALFNVIVVVFLTAWISWKLNIFPWAWLIGMIIGLLIGYLLCRFSKLLK